MARILIVEDEEQVRVLAEGVIQEMGHQTLTAGNLEEATALLATEEKIDLLFADIRLVRELHGGISVAKHARESRPDVRVLY